ncbi:MAG: rhodanese-like domain-containing protein, partial [Alphaproteobacteria bacterium]
MTDGLSPAALHERLRRAMAEGRELALLDVREELCFGRDGHLLFAVNLPLSRLELRIADMVPRRDTPLITIDGGDDETLASRAAARLRQLGYSAVECLAGGVNGWADAGFEVFDDVNVPIKGFAAATVAQNDTPRIAPADLGRRLTAGETFVLLDSRPVNEFRAGALPGAIVCPGPDLLRRFKDVVPDDKTPVVVNCMTRTRGLLGAQTLIDAGVPNPVYGLDGGTWGWRLAGYDLQAGSQNLPPRLSAQARHHAAAAAERLAEQFSIPRLSREQVSELRADRRRTTYLLDVRSRQEYREGHIPGSISAPGTELVMSPFQHVATLNAR